MPVVRVAPLAAVVLVPQELLVVVVLVEQALTQVVLVGRVRTLKIL
jgi:hypothetical protein